MGKTLLSLANSDSAITMRELEDYATGWLLDCEYRQHSKSTLAFRRLLLDKLLWFLRQNELPTCGANEIKRFLVYLGRGHEEPGGRWGNARNCRPMRPSSVQSFYRHLRTFFRFLVDSEYLAVSPMEKMGAPLARADQVQPFTQEQVRDLLAAAKRTHQPRRDEAILLLLFDTGIRASELCGLSMKDVDVSSRQCTVLGKGNKKRAVYFSGTTAKALWQYLRGAERGPEDPVFTADRGEGAGDALTRYGLLQLFERLGKAAKITGVRCSPHTARHFAATEFLKAGGDQFSLMQLLGHTQLTMTSRYVSLVAADVASTHRRCSPVERLKGKER